MVPFPGVERAPTPTLTPLSSFRPPTATFHTTPTFHARFAPHPQILKLVQKIESEELSVRAAQKALDDKLGYELAQRLHLEEADYSAACLIYSEEAHALSEDLKSRKKAEEKDAVEARRIMVEEKRLALEEEHERNAENCIAEEKGERKAKKEQSIEIRALHDAHKKLRSVWSRTRFVPVLSPLGIRLVASLPSVFTVNLTVDTKRKVLSVEALSEVPTFPKAFDDVILPLKIDAARFRAELFFDRKIDIAWDDLKVSYSIDKLKGELSISIDKPGGDRTWLLHAAIYADYKNGWLANMF